MGHMVGFYKPFSEIDQELDSCKKKIENLQQKNNFLTKEVQQFSRPSRIIFGDNSNYTMTIKFICLNLGSGSEEHRQVIRYKGCKK